MRTLISVASICTLFVLAASNAACSRTTHTSVSDKSQPKPVRPDTDTTHGTTSDSTRYPADLPGDTGFQHDTTTHGATPNNNTMPPSSTTPGNSTIPKHDTTSKSPSDKKLGSGAQQPESTDPAQRDADNKLAAQVRSAIIADSTVAANADAVNVTCRSGIVTLQGNVKDQEQKDAIVLAVQRVPGVDRVDDQLSLPRH